MRNDAKRGGGPQQAEHGVGICGSEPGQIVGGQWTLGEAIGNRKGGERVNDLRNPIACRQLLHSDEGFCLFHRHLPSAKKYGSGSSSRQPVDIVRLVGNKPELHSRSKNFSSAVPPT